MDVSVHSQRGVAGAMQVHAMHTVELQVKLDSLVVSGAQPKPERALRVQYPKATYHSKYVLAKTPTGRRTPGISRHARICSLTSGTMSQTWVPHFSNHLRVGMGVASVHLIFVA